MKHYRGADQAVRDMSRRALKEGTMCSPRNMETCDLFGESFLLEDPRHRLVKSRPLREGYSAAKVAWDLGEREDVETITQWNPHGARFSDDGRVIQGENYGKRWFKYLTAAIDLLEDDRHSRRAWVPVWRGTDVLGEGGSNPSMDSKNIPCCLGFSLRINEDKLIMQTVMRSQSLWGVMPYDLFLFTVMQELIANEMRLKLGHYEHFMMSAHVYERESKAIRNMPNQSKIMVQPMESIGFTLQEARGSYCALFEELCEGNVMWEKGGYYDPVELMMLENQPNA